MVTTDGVAKWENVKDKDMRAKHWTQGNIFRQESGGGVVCVEELVAGRYESIQEST